MKVEDLVEALELEVLAGEAGLTREVSGGYAGDLLSDVLANSSPDQVWITLQTHQNTIAVAVTSDLAGVIIVNGREPDPEMLEKAEAERMPVLRSADSTFELVGQVRERLQTGSTS